MQEHGGVSEVHVVEAWHAALNEGDVDRLVGLSHPDVEIGGPRGIGRGVQLLREWVDRANVRLDPRRVFRRGSTVVVEQSGQWRSAESGEVIGSQTVASVFTVCDGLVTSLVRYEDLSEALKTAGLEQSDEIRPEHRARGQ
ncbi:MAG TPA: nuclear transport factor 2 family protein [Rubrobacter sp.]|nr:nuclear transport factor 2 family protein [Rubrobacter sp.]